MNLLRYLLQWIGYYQTPHYKPKDDIEYEVSKFLAHKQNIKIQNTDITIELYYNQLDSDDYIQIDKVLNNTFQNFKKYFFVPEIEGLINFRLFMLDSQEEFNKTIKNIYSMNTDNKILGLAFFSNEPLVSYSDMFIFKYNDTDSTFEYNEILECNKTFLYETISHEFVHALTFLPIYFYTQKDSVYQDNLFEGMADFISLQTVHQSESLTKKVLDYGIKNIINNNLNLEDIVYRSVPYNDYTLGFTIVSFFEEKHPQLLKRNFECLYNDDDDCYKEIKNKIHEISENDFIEWLNEWRHD